MKNVRFVDIKNDVAFRKIFGNEKKTAIIISFLNATLKLEGEHRIEEVSIVNPYQLPRVAGEKASIIDVRAKDKRGRQFVVEMQVADVNGFDKRVQYYTCRDYSMQIERGQQYALLRPTYFVGILDFNFFKGEKYLSHHLIMDDETYEHKLKDIQFAFIELEKFTLKKNELQTLIDVIPDHVDDEGLREAYKDAEKHNWEKEELIAYDNASIAIQDEIGRLEAATLKGIRKRNKEVIEQCLKLEMSVEDMAKITSLSVKEVRAIIEEIE